MQKHLHFLHFAPVIFTSALEKTHKKEIFMLIDRIWQDRQRSIPQDQLTILLEKALFHKRPAVLGKKKAKIFGVQQTNKNPLTLTLTINDIRLFNSLFLRYIRNFFREELELYGSDVVIELLEKEKT